MSVAVLVRDRVRYHSWVPFLSALVAITACTSEHRPHSSDIVAMADIGIDAAFAFESPGADSGYAVLHRIADGVLLNERIALLDRSPPYVRIFNTSGVFIAAMVRHGEGPGEAEDPLSLERFDDETILLTEPKALSLIGLDGTLRRTIGSPAGVMRGASAACADGILILHTASDGFGPEGMISIVRDDHVQILTRLDTLRGSSRREHPAYIAGNSQSIALYTEEAHRQRLLNVDCVSGVLQEIAVDTLGPAERWEALEEGQWTLHPSQPPYPAGVIRIPGGLLWARQSIQTLGTDTDSITIVDVMDTNSASRRRLLLHGWYQVLDSDRDGRTLWALRDDDEGDRAVVVSAAALERAISEHGSTQPALLAQPARLTPPPPPAPASPQSYPES